jgi:hypothetical protein
MHGRLRRNPNLRNWRRALDAKGRLQNRKQVGATETFCAVTEKTSDGFVSIRSGPGIDYNVLGKVYPLDFLYVGTERCRNDFGQALFSEDGRWVFVEQVHRQSKAFILKGWIKNSLIRQVTCPDD